MTLMPEAKVNPDPDQLLEDLSAPTVLESSLNRLEAGLTGTFTKS